MQKRKGRQKGRDGIWNSSPLGSHKRAIDLYALVPLWTQGVYRELEALKAWFLGFHPKGSENPAPLAPLAPLALPGPGRPEFPTPPALGMISSPMELMGN